MLIPAKEVKLKNGETLVLKSPTADDAQKLLDHLKNVFAQSYQNMNFPKSYWDNFPVEEEAKILADFASSSSKFILSAFQGEKIVGNLGCFGSGGDFLRFNARIGMGLENEFLNVGLGTALLNYAIENAKQNKMHRLELTVRTFNEAGIALYQKVGFRRVGVLKDIAFIDGKFCDEFMYEMLIGNK